LFPRSAAAILLLLACCGVSPGQPSADARCSVAAFESDAAKTVEDCTSVIDGAGLPDAARAQALKIRARSRHVLGRIDDAIRDYELALRLAPDDPELHLRRGWTAFDQRDFETVFGQAEQALALKPGFASAYDLIGAAVVARDSRQRAQARAAYDEAVRLEPQNPIFRYHIVQLLTMRGPWPEALQAADDLLALPVASITKPNALEYFRKRTSYRTATAIERGRILDHMGRLEEAEKAYDQAVAYDPGAMTFGWRSAFHLQHSAPRDVVQADLDRSLAADSNYWVSQEVAGRFHFYGKDYQTAAQEFAHAIELAPDNGMLRWWHAMALHQLGRLEDAAEEAATAFRLDRDFMFQKLPMLQQRGYLPTLSPNVDPRPALLDAARACMLDEGCW
jgi:tetratricopeptide (TPR) repeat protein